jgi:tetratricopeptide (TPR) repeat protein
MKLGRVVLAGCLVVSAISEIGCSRNRQEAVLLSNDADKEVTLNPDGAVNKYEQATRMDPTNHRIMFKLALAYRKKEDWEKVASTLARAVQIAPKFANYWFERGYALEQQARKKVIGWNEAREPFENCIKNDPNFADCYEELGNVFLYTDDEQKAVENYTKAIEHDPTQIRYYPALADLYISLGFMKEAEQVLKEAKGFAKPGDKMLYGVHVLMSKVYQDRSSTAEMVSELEAAKQIAPSEGPESVTILFSLGSTYATLKPPRKEEAIQNLKGFNARACKGAKATSFKTECEQAQALVSGLGGTLQ